MSTVLEINHKKHFQEINVEFDMLTTDQIVQWILLIYKLQTYTIIHQVRSYIQVAKEKKNKRIRK